MVSSVIGMYTAYLYMPTSIIWYARVKYLLIIIGRFAFFLLLCRLL